MAELEDALRELLESRTEAMGLGDDEESRQLRQEIEGEIDKAAGDVLRAAGIQASTGVTLDAIMTADPAKLYELQWDDGRWYPCLVEELKYDFERSAPVARVRLLGYNQLDNAVASRLRPWSAANAVKVAAGDATNAINPRTGKFEACVVERLTMRGLIAVRFGPPAAGNATAAAPSTSAAPSGPAGTGERAEVPAWCILPGRVFDVLRKRVENMTESERQAAEEEARQKKREAVSAKRAANADKLDAQAEEFKQFFGQVARPQPAASSAAGSIKPFVSGPKSSYTKRAAPKQR